MASSSTSKRPRKATLSQALGVERRTSTASLARVNQSAPPRTPGREGKKAIVGFFPPQVSKQLKQIAVDEDTSIQDLMAEALNDLFLKRSKPAIA
jgi:hypothetical protein